VPEAEPLLAAAAALVLVGVLASKVSTRLGVPALLLFLGVGMLAGSDGVGGIHFDDFELAQSLGIVALAFILFAGGLSTTWAEVRPVLAPGIALATVGVVVTALVAGGIAAWALDLSATTGFLLGAIISSTDAAAVFSVLRSRNVSLRGEIRPLLELESGSNDPMAVFLTVGFLELLTDPGRSVLSLLPLFAQQMAVGAVFGYVLARGTVVAINRLHLEYEGLYPVVTLAVVVLTYGVTALLGGSGFLAVYVAGIVMGNREFLHKKSLMRFHDAIAWLSQISMFLVLGLLVFPSELPEVAGRALLVAAALVFVARPLAVLVALAPTGLGARARAMVSWVGLRGAVPIILATFPLAAGINEAETIFDVVFFIVLTSVLLQGTTIPLVARWLSVDAPLPSRPPYPLEAVSSADGATSLHEITIPNGSPVAGRQLVEIGLPAGALVVLISRDGQFVVPQGATVLHSGDNALVLADADNLSRVRGILEGRGPDGEQQ
jgi:potassium/hydrogen antiporter